MPTMEYKISDIIGLSTMDGLDLLEITDIIHINDEDLGEICLSVKLLRNVNLEKPWSNVTGSVLLPQQRYEIRTKEEYFEEMQHEIDKKQNILNELKEKYEQR